MAIIRSQQTCNAEIEAYLDQFSGYSGGKWIARTLRFQFTDGLTVGELCSLAALAFPNCEDAADVADTLRRFLEEKIVTHGPDRVLRIKK